MATIYPVMQQQGQSQSQFQQPDPIVSAQSRQTSSAQDPLFEALVKYITGTPGPSSVTSSEIEDIISSHVNQQGGRAYLESIVSPPSEPHIKVWKNQAQASGFLSTNMDSLTLVFSATRNMIFQKVDFRGNCPGFYPPQVFMFDDKARLYWDELADSMSVRIEISYLSALNIITVAFLDGSNKRVAELIIRDAAVRLPEHPIQGTGVFKFPQGPQ